MSRRPPLLIHPTLPEVRLQAAKIGLPDDEAMLFFYYYQSNGWKVGKTPMKCWLSALSGWKVRWWSKQPQNRRGPPSGADKMIWEKEYERIIARMKGIQDCYDAHRTWTQAHVDEFRKLKVRRDELRGKLGIML